MRAWWLDPDEDDEPEWLRRLICGEEQKQEAPPWRSTLLVYGSAIRHALAAPVGIVTEPSGFDAFYDYARSVLGSELKFVRVRDEIFAFRA